MKVAEFEELKRRYPTYAQFFHWVGPGGHIKEGYYRRIPRTYYDRRSRPSAQLRTQLTFADVTHDSFGQKGLREGLPVAAYNFKKSITGKRFREPAWKKAVEELRKSLREIAAVVEAKET